MSGFLYSVDSIKNAAVMFYDQTNLPTQKVWFFQDVDSTTSQQLQKPFKTAELQ